MNLIVEEEMLKMFNKCWDLFLIRRGRWKLFKSSCAGLVQKLKEDVRILSAQLANVNFTYRDPIKNFHESKMEGAVARPLKVKDSSTTLYSSTVVASMRKTHEQAEVELNQIRRKMKECDTQISFVKEKQKLQVALCETNLEKRKMENEVKRMEMEWKYCSLKVEKMIERHAWIASEGQLFERNGTDNDFASCDPLKAREKLKKLQAEQSGVFGSMSPTLLPGTTAKLEPPAGCSFFDGLEVRGVFGGAWKQSLLEVSGGQRSLLALSLILVLLLFKPAPLYIIDEVDAALDLSHTQNLGRMIKNHFPHSQGHSRKP